MACGPNFRHRLVFTFLKDYYYFFNERGEWNREKKNETACGTKR